MSLADEVANAAGNVLAPIAENTVSRVVAGVTEALTSFENDVLGKLSGKEIQVTIKIPDLTK
jgi:hypothetical protein